MMANAKKRPDEPTTIEAHDPETLPGGLKLIGGSACDDFNNVVSDQAVSALWLKHSDTEKAKKQFNATLAAQFGISPKDELEGMLAAQLIARRRQQGAVACGLKRKARRLPSARPGAGSCGGRGSRKCWQ